VTAPRALSVLLPLPLPGPYDYAVPEGLTATEGQLVAVSLSGRERIGAVWGAAQGIAAERLKPIERVLPAAPLPEVTRRFVDWVADYTMAPPGSVLRMVIAGGDLGTPERPRRGLRLADPSGGPAEPLKMTAARRRVLDLLADGLARPASEIAAEAGVGASVVKGLRDLNLIETVTLPRPRWPLPDPEHPLHALSPAQEAAAAALRQQVRAGGFQVTLLDGVTGSGKTEVYLEAVAETLRRGKQVLVLLPEIALSAQLLARFEARFGAPPLPWHSDLSQKERRRHWRAAASGEARLIVGARSALFLPYAALGLIVVDEEHEAAFKQEDGVVYQARDMAVVRAQLGGFPLVLASATPSLETLANVSAGRYGRLLLPERVGGAALPDSRLIDLRRYPPPKIKGLGQAWLSEPLREALSDTLRRGEQSLLYLNRRGYAPLTLCRHCGFRLGCPACTAWLVEHRLAGRLQCHHCGYVAQRPLSCPECGTEDSLVACGPGIERLSEEVRHLFPEARLALFSSDLLNGPRAAAELVTAVQEGEIDILIGTQVVAKGHHFPQLTLVGIVDGDLGAEGGDPRAAERSFQLLHQVAGRAGRATKAGRVMIQTHNPGQRVMQALAAQDRDAFIESEMALRRQSGYPPYGRLAAIIVAAPDELKAARAAEAIGRCRPDLPQGSILGPAPAPFSLLRGWYRHRFLLQAPRGVKLQPVLRRWLSQVRLESAVRVTVDIDPYSFL